VLFTARKSHSLDAENYQVIAPMASAKKTDLFRKNLLT
jgi:hypothetical protein